MVEQQHRHHHKDYYSPSPPLFRNKRMLTHADHLLLSYFFERNLPTIHLTNIKTNIPLQRLDTCSVFRLILFRITYEELRDLLKKLRLLYSSPSPPSSSLSSLSSSSSKSTVYILAMLDDLITRIEDIITMRNNNNNDNNDNKNNSSGEHSYILATMNRLRRLLNHVGYIAYAYMPTPQYLATHLVRYDTITLKNLWQLTMLDPSIYNNKELLLDAFLVCIVNTRTAVPSDALKGVESSRLFDEINEYKEERERKHRQSILARHKAIKNGSSASTSSSASGGSSDILFIPVIIFLGYDEKKNNLIVAKNRIQTILVRYKQRYYELIITILPQRQRQQRLRYEEEEEDMNKEEGAFIL